MRRGQGADRQSLSAVHWSCKQTIRSCEIEGIVKFTRMLDGGEKVTGENQKEES